MPASSVSRAHDVLQYERQPLEAIFAPKNIAVIGATEKEGSVGRTILWNLLSNPSDRTIFPVNLKRRSVLGIQAYPNIAALPAPVDLAVIVTPAATVPEVMRECADAGVKGAIIISAGFKEIGAAGAELERQILEHANRGGMRVIGPNCVGVMRPATSLNATFANAMARPGAVGFVSQSGALCTAVLDWSLREHVGFSAFISVGSMLDVGWGDLIYYLGDDPQTECIVMYMETIGDARSFLSAAREVALTKPIIVIKAGRTEAAAKAAASHTGSLTGSDQVLDAAFRRAGVLRVNSIADLFYMAEVLGKQPRPQGPRLTILTNAGGPAVLAADALIQNGGQLAELSAQTMQALDEFLPPHWSHNNPIDILGDAGPERYAQALEIAAQDPGSDGLLVITTPQGMTAPTEIAEKLTPYARLAGKPILASWMGGDSVEAAELILNRANIPTFGFPDTAARIFDYMWRYSYNLRGLYETPVLPAQAESDHARARGIIDAVRKSKRTILTEHESKQLLTAYGIPTIETRVARSESEAVQHAAAIGYPVVLKLHSETITHKTDVGGVQLNLANADAVRSAYGAIEAAVRQKASTQDFMGVTVQPMINLEGYELILGSSMDAQFGPVLLFGLGGQLVEVFKDRALALPPLNSTLARRMIEQTQIYQALKGVRGRQPIDLAALDELLVKFSQLVIEQPWIKEMDINPLLAAPERLLALDARVVLHEPGLKEERLPRPAIRPYPLQYVQSFTLKNGQELTIRPIRPEDEPLMVKFHETLSESTVYMRYFQPLQLNRRIAHDRLTRICFVDYDREMVLVAERHDPETGAREIAGVGRLSRAHAANEAEFAILISDPYQRLGLGRELLQRLVEIGRREKLERITADILPDNLAMQRVSEQVGFHLHRAKGEDVVGAELRL